MKQGNEFIADVIYDETLGIEDGCTLIDPMDSLRQKTLPRGTKGEDLLVPVFEAGGRVYDVPPIHVSRERTQTQLSSFHAGVKRLANPHAYPVGLERKLYELKTELVLNARRQERALS
jgi:nicotinate phosphoribosyltransferase